MFNPLSTETSSCRGILCSKKEVKIKPSVRGCKYTCVYNIYLLHPDELGAQGHHEATHFQGKCEAAVGLAQAEGSPGGECEKPSLES